MKHDNLYYVESLESLYEAVQSQKIFKDSKYFVDSVPNREPAEILNDYLEQKDQPGFQLLKFVDQNFTYPPDYISDYHSANKPIRQHLEDLWEVLKRTPAHSGGTLVPLPNDYIVPGGRFREVYYWDSYFTMLGLQVSGKVQIIENMVDNFAYLVNELGLIPNGNRTYYLGRSQPPFFSLMVELLAEEKGEKTLLKYEDALEKEYNFWMSGSDELTAAEPAYRRVVQTPDSQLLNRYWDERDWVRPEAFNEDGSVCERSGRPMKEVARHLRGACESGWDFSSRWFRDGMNMTSIEACDIAPIDLNCLLLHLEQLLAKIAAIKNNKDATGKYKAAADRRKAALLQCCWSDDDGAFFDYHFRDKQPIKKITAAIAYPLFFQIANESQAKTIALMLKEHLLTEGGLVTTTVRSGQQWDSPNGWAPLQWIAYKGLLNYGENDIAADLRKRWLATCENVYLATGKMMEKYNVVDTEVHAGGGEYPNQDGFGWTNGVYLKMLTDKPQ